METGDLYKTTLAHVFNVSDISHWKILTGQILARLGIPFVVLVFMALLSLAAPLTSKKSIKIPVLAGIWGLLVITLFLYWTSPYSGTNFTIGERLTPWFGQAIRYGLPFIGVLGAAAAAGTRVWRYPPLAAAALVLISAVSAVTIGKHFAVNTGGIYRTPRPYCC
jgi:hypothetical protein